MYKETIENKFLKEFFAKMDESYLAITFADVKLKSGHSKVMPDDVKVNSYFSKNVPLKVPIVSAAMDTVTESKLAIGMASFGGIGVIHKALTIEQQAEEVKKVKTYMNGLILSPFTVSMDTNMSFVKDMIENEELNFSTFPVVDDSNKLLGILTRTDIEFCDDLKMKVTEYMNKEILTGSSDVDLEESYEIMKKGRKKFLPLIDSEGKLAGIYTLSDVKRLLHSEKSDCNIDKNGQLRVAAAIGIKDYDRAKALIDAGVDALVIDTAHGDTEAMIETIKYLKSMKGRKVDVVAGNISEPTGIKALIEAGADAIKVGQGPGSICTTRIIAGIGAPQLTAVYKCVTEAQKQGNKVPIIADGGIQYSGDIPMAIGVGASSVMLGSLLAGTDESPGMVVLVEGNQYKTYRGMGSVTAMQNSAASRERYGQNDNVKSSIVPEGIEGLIAHRGKLFDVLTQYKVGLQRGMGYVGAADIAELKLKAKFHRLTQSAVQESHPHDIVSIKEAPNYKK